VITQSDHERLKRQSQLLLKCAGIAVTAAELEGMDVADFGLGEVTVSGAQILNLLDTPQLAVRLIVLLPHQTEPEHTHVAQQGYVGKYETLRCAYGCAYVYSPGPPTPEPQATPPAHRRHTYTVFHETILSPGQQCSFAPNTPHWFQGGAAGAVLWSFSTQATDNRDVFTDPDIVRKTVVQEAVMR
jgi:D-lyxose ketol-isomerase